MIAMGPAWLGMVDASAVSPLITFSVSFRYLRSELWAGWMGNASVCSAVVDPVRVVGASLSSPPSPSLPSASPVLPLAIALTSHCYWASVRISRYISPPCPPAEDQTSEARGVPLWHLCWRMKFDRDARIGGSHGSPYSMLFAIASAIIMGINPP